MRAPKAQDVDEYIGRFPPPVRQRLERLRATIHRAAPGGVEKISYDIPTVAVDGKPLLYFAAFAKHVSVYPAPRGAAGFADELKAYPGGKGTVQFAHDAPVPYDLVARIAKHHLERIRAQKPAGKKPKAPATKKAPAPRSRARPSKPPARSPKRT